MKLSHRIATTLPSLFFALPAFGHNTGAVHDHGIGYLLALAVLIVGIVTWLRQ